MCVCVCVWAHVCGSCDLLTTGGQWCFALVDYQSTFPSSWSVARLETKILQPRCITHPSLCPWPNNKLRIERWKRTEQKRSRSCRISDDGLKIFNVSSSRSTEIYWNPTRSWNTLSSQIISTFNDASSSQNPITSRNISVFGMATDCKARRMGLVAIWRAFPGLWFDHVFF